MGSKVTYVSGEPFTVKDSKTIVDHVLEGPGVHHSTATDTRGNTHEAGGLSQKEAEDKAIFGVIKNRNDD